jgi:hypothetical protein
MLFGLTAFGNNNGENRVIRLTPPIAVYGCSLFVFVPVARVTILMLLYFVFAVFGAHDGI